MSVYERVVSELVELYQVFHSEPDADFIAKKLQVQIRKKKVVG